MCSHTSALKAPSQREMVDTAICQWLCNQLHVSPTSIRLGQERPTHTAGNAQISTNTLPDGVNWFTVGQRFACVRDMARMREREWERKRVYSMCVFWESLPRDLRRGIFKLRVSSSDVTYPPLREIDSLLWIQVKAAIPNWLCPLNPLHSWWGDADEAQENCYRKNF